jgi:hypothetical protein
MSHAMPDLTFASNSPLKTPYADCLDNIMTCAGEIVTAPAFAYARIFSPNFFSNFLSLGAITT